jgi:hypothetical protein
MWLGRLEHLVIEHAPKERQDCSRIPSTSASIGAVLRPTWGESCEYRDHA